MALFIDREDAARRLADALADYRGEDPIVLALPRGGVVLGRIVADALGAPLDLVVPRKIGAPGNLEYAIGAITETGEGVWNEEEERAAGAAFVRAAVAKERAEAARRLAVYRGGRPPRNLSGRTVIIVDDGIATGYTMRAAIGTVRAERPRTIVVAVPVAPADTVAAMRRTVDAFVVLEVPPVFGAIGEFYDAFPQVDDATVTNLMKGH